MTEELLTRLKQATEGSEELDVAIGREWYGYGPDDPLWHMMPFSRSLDAALTLVPEKWSYFIEYIHGMQAQAHIGLMRKTGQPRDPLSPRLDKQIALEATFRQYQAWAWTPALALCIAALRARE